MNEIETKSKIKDRIEAIKKEGGKFKFITLENSIFKNNLVLIDSLLPNIVAEIIKTFFTTALSSTKDLTDSINKVNPLDYDTQFAHTFYDYKIKRFLTDVALGMTPSKNWDGSSEANGGYLIVKSNGDLVCYHIYDRDVFKKYLLNNTYFEAPSRSRHHYGIVYAVDNKLKINLNLQIRFTS